MMPENGRAKVVMESDCTVLRCLLSVPALPSAVQIVVTPLLFVSPLSAGPGTVNDIAHLRHLLPFLGIWHKAAT